MSQFLQLDTREARDYAIQHGNLRMIMATRGFHWTHWEELGKYRNFVTLREAVRGRILSDDVYITAIIASGDLNAIKGEENWVKRLHELHDCAIRCAGASMSTSILEYVITQLQSHPLTKPDAFQVATISAYANVGALGPVKALVEDLPEPDKSDIRYILAGAVGGWHYWVMDWLFETYSDLIQTSWEYLYGDLIRIRVELSDDCTICDLGYIVTHLGVPRTSLVRIYGWAAACAARSGKGQFITSILARCLFDSPHIITDILRCTMENACLLGHSAAAACVLDWLEHNDCMKYMPRLDWIRIAQTCAQKNERKAAAFAREQATRLPCI
jgi:hypothetical protein